MLIISHRGNISGPNLELENNPTQVLKVLTTNEVEIDVWLIDKKFFLGHDYPQYKIDQSFLLNKGLWCHAKNLEALNLLLDLKVNCFWHENDLYTLTSNGIIWTYPQQRLCSKSIIVDLDPNWKEKKYNCLGVCVDFLD